MNIFRHSFKINIYGKYEAKLARMFDFFVPLQFCILNL